MTGTFKIQQDKIIQQRFNARIRVLIMFGCLLFVFLLLIAFTSKPADFFRDLTTLFFIMLVVVFSALIAIFANPSVTEKSVIILDHDPITLSINDREIASIPFDEIVEIKSINLGFFIVRAGYDVTSSMLRRGNYEWRIFEGVIYIPEIVQQYDSIKNFLIKKVR